ncbi:MAG: AgmX/PglI C-terminal domain-containing protein [Bdellovibrio sp.]|nr:AgmX/PglI C-terminal domain-containing protein [Bdellovibrio sp.]
MFYLQDSDGNVVRAISWSGEKMIFVLRYDTRRVETCEDVSAYDEAGIEYTILDTVNKSKFAKSGVIYPVKGGHLSLVQSSTDGMENVLANVELPYDDDKQFEVIAKKTAITGVAAAILLFGLSFIITPKEAIKEELQVVQVMDRQQIEKSIVVPVSETKVAKMKPRAVKRITAPAIKKAVAVKQSSGVLGVLGSLNKSKQQGGLKLSDAQASAGIGRGGSQGSGGMQTTVYSKGMFSAPLGSGGKVNGGGGYGTRGKGGGQAGYGQVSLVGAGSGFFQPVESEAWVGGGLDRNEIAAVIQRHISEVRFCYEQGLQTKPKLSGRLSMDFMIGPSGSVSVAKVNNSSLDHVPVENCIRNRLRTWNFPKPEGGVTVKVTYPFILRRVSDT